MSDNAAVARRWFREVWSPDGERAVDAMMAPEATGVMEGGPIGSIGEFKAARRQFMGVFPDLQVEVEDVISQDENVAVRWTARGTHRGDGLGVAPTNRRVEIRGMTWVRLRDGRIVQGWDCWNLGGLITSLQQPERPIA